MIEVVSEQRCIKCDICVRVCPTNVFDAVEDASPVIARQHDCQTVNTFGNPPQALRPVIHRIHACHDGEQHLRRTDVARRFLSSDVLFACLKRQPVRSLSAPVL